MKSTLKNENTPGGRAFKVTITETYQRTVTIYESEMKEPTVEEAQRVAEDWWQDSQIELGTEDFQGGWTHINERGGEMAYLPSGTAIIPADKTDEIINNSTSSSSVTYEDHSTFSPTISITLGGETTKADAEEIVRRVKQAMEDFWQEKKEEEYHERTLQGAYAQ